MDSGTVTSFLHDLITNYGSPMEILTDRGQSFLSEGIQQYIKDLVTKHRLTSPYHPDPETIHQSRGLFRLAQQSFSPCYTNCRTNNSNSNIPQR